jgi:DNA-3-methyladenine glycosylase II
VPDYWRDACRELSKHDQVLKGLIAEYKDVRFRSRGTAFETLLRAIVGQQISIKAAQAIWARFEERVGKVSPDSVAEVSVLELRACGLSMQKVSYMQDLAGHFASGRINPRGFKALEDETLIEELCEVRGIGRWTAEMFLIFRLNRPDVYPVQDIGLIRAIERHYFDGKNISKSEVAAFGERWRPWRSVATWYLWRSLDPFPVEY